jgi:ABC-type multidrug transport system fused ATPase/permease subunit
MHDTHCSFSLPAAVQESTTSSLLKSFFRDFLWPHKWTCIKIGALMVFSVALQLPAPILTMYIIDHVLPLKSFGLLNGIIGLLLALTLLRHVFSYLNETSTLRLRELIIMEVQKRLTLHIQRLPISFFADKQSTYLQSRVMSDGRAIEGVLIKSLVSLAINLLLFVAGLVFVLLLRYEVVFILAAFLAPFAMVRYYANKKMRELSRDMQETTALASAFIAESFAGIRVVKSYVREEFQQGMITERLESLKKIFVRTNLVAVFSTVATSLLMALSAASILWYGSRNVITGHMTLGEVVAILSMFSFFYQPINEFVASNLKFHQAAASVKRIYEFFGLKQERRDGQHITGKCLGRIEFKNVDFAYIEGHNVLQDVSILIEPGRHIALVGRSGAGKSTLVNLLLGFYSPAAGEIRVDDVPISSLALDSLRENIGIVDQNGFLFSGTIAENVRLGRPSATSEEVVEACQLSYADEFITNLPNGYNTLVGERGVRLSGGQCQRIALARMFLKNPSILILDEAVSSIDSESESYIHGAMHRLMASRTTIIIAHRLSSVLVADDVVVLQDGKVVENGTHNSLLGENGVYARLFREQFGPAIHERGRAEVFTANS